jgi:hypothetical protein
MEVLQAVISMHSVLRAYLQVPQTNIFHNWFEYFIQ